MFALVGIRFHIMAELIEIKTKIDKLLDRLSITKDPQQKELILSQLRRNQQALMNWYGEHGSN